MIQEHSLLYKKSLSTYKVNLYQYKKTKDGYSTDVDYIVSFCCAHCKMWHQCVSDGIKNNGGSKRDICYIAKEVENKTINFTCGFSSGLSDSYFIFKPKNKDQEKYIDKIRKHLLKKYKVH